jgi:altronate hydrolase
MIGNVNFIDAAPMGKVTLSQVAVKLHPEDDVAIAKVNIPVGTTLQLDSGMEISAQRLIPSGHKIALREIAAGEALRRYGQVIGFATETIAAGEQVHTHNLAVQDFARDYAH